MNLNKCLAIVDDQPEVHDLLSAFFKPKGYKLISFSSAEEALGHAALANNEWDAVITDFHFPNMGSIEFILQMREIIPGLPIIVMTPPGYADVAHEAIKHGAWDFVTTPINFLQLQLVVDRAIEAQEKNADSAFLLEQIKESKVGSTAIIGRSPVFIKALDLARRVAKSTASIFIKGESGVGKEVFAKFIHQESLRARGPYVAINCSALPENLLESELFGHAKGSFTGAIAKKIGLFEEAQNGTLFLDEIGDLTLNLQSKLLRVLQEKNIRRVGENQYRPINCRIICATHKDLALEVGEGRFREDLFFRLNVIPISIPPLRERAEDILPLAEFFMRKFALENSSPVRSLSADAVRYILENPWRGNVRELENTIERAVIVGTRAEISIDNFMPLNSGLALAEKQNLVSCTAQSFVLNFEGALPSLDDVTHRYIEFAIAKNSGAKDRTAKDIGIDRKTLYKKMRQRAEDRSIISVNEPH